MSNEFSAKTRFEVSDKVAIWETTLFNHDNHDFEQLNGINFIDGSQFNILPRKLHCTNFEEDGGNSASCDFCGSMGCLTDSWETSYNTTQAADIGGTKIVYMDNSHICFEGGTGPWIYPPYSQCADIMLYDLKTKQTTPISTKAAFEGSPSIDGNIVAWTVQFKDYTTRRRLFYKNIDTGEEVEVGEGELPTVVDQKIYFSKYILGRGSVQYVYDIQTEQMSEIPISRYSSIGGTYSVEHNSSESDTITITNLQTQNKQSKQMPHNVNVLRIHDNLVAYTGQDSNYGVYTHNIQTNENKIISKSNDQSYYLGNVGDGLVLYYNTSSSADINPSYGTLHSSKVFLYSENGLECGDSICLPNEVGSCQVDCQIESTEQNSNPDTLLVTAGQNGIQVYNANNGNPQFISNWSNVGSIVRAVRVENDIAYLAEDSGFYVVDINDKTNLFTLGFLPLAGKPYNLDIVNDKAYVITDSGGLYVISISDPTSPNLIGTYPDCNAGRDVQVKDNYAYLACNDPVGDLITLDVTDHNNIQKVMDMWAYGTTPSDIEIYENYLLFSTLGGEVTLFDISNPLGDNNGNYPIYTHANTWIAYDSEIAGDYIYTASGWQIYVHPFTTYNMGANLVAHKEVNDVWFQDIEISNGVAYVADNFWGIKTYNVTDPSNPILITSIDTGDDWNWDFVVIPQDDPNPPEQSVCGDNQCTLDETVTTCSQDCAVENPPTALQVNDIYDATTNIAPIDDPGVLVSFRTGARKYVLGTEIGRIHNDLTYNDFEEASSLTPLLVRLRLESPEQDVTIHTERGEFTIHLPANPGGDHFYYVGEDGSTYYGSLEHGGGLDLNPQDALIPAHLARSAGAVCGNNICEADESAQSCSYDCTESVTRLSSDGKQINPRMDGDYVVWQSLPSEDSNVQIQLYQISTKTTNTIGTTPNKICTRSDYSIFECNSYSPIQINIDIQGSKIVYEDWNHLCTIDGVETACPDIKLYDITTGETTLVSSKPIRQTNPQVDGNNVYWQEEIHGDRWDNQNIWVKNLETGESQIIGKGILYSVDDDYFAYNNGSFYSSNISIINQETGESRQLLDYQGIDSIFLMDNKLLYDREVYDKNFWTNYHKYVYTYDLSSGSNRFIVKNDNPYYPIEIRKDGNKIVYSKYPDRPYNTMYSKPDLYTMDVNMFIHGKLSQITGSQVLGDLQGNTIVYHTTQYDEGDIIMRQIPDRVNTCGNGFCQEGEDSLTCSADCLEFKELQLNLTPYYKTTTLPYDGVFLDENYQYEIYPGPAEEREIGTPDYKIYYIKEIRERRPTVTLDLGDMKCDWIEGFGSGEFDCETGDNYNANKISISRLQWDVNQNMVAFSDDSHKCVDFVDPYTRIQSCDNIGVLNLLTGERYTMYGANERQRYPAVSSSVVAWRENSVGYQVDPNPKLVWKNFKNGNEGEIPGDIINYKVYDEYFAYLDYETEIITIINTNTMQQSAIHNVLGLNRFEDGYIYFNPIKDPEDQSDGYTMNRYDIRTGEISTVTTNLPIAITPVSDGIVIYDRADSIFMKNQTDEITRIVRGAGYQIQDFRKGFLLLYSSGVYFYSTLYENTNSCSGDCGELTGPIINVSFPSHYGNNTIFASVSDPNGLQNCEVCFANDGICDTEWTQANNGFEVGDLTGNCSAIPLVKGTTKASFRVTNTQSESSEIAGTMFIDTEKPQITNLQIPIPLASSTPYSISYEIEDESPATVEITFNGEPVETNNNIFNIITPNEWGDYLLTLNVTDAAGNNLIRNQMLQVNYPITWSEELNLAKTNSASISYDSDAHIVWEENSNIKYAQVKSDASIVSYAIKITDNIFNSKNPNIFAESGNVHIVYEDDRDGNTEIYYSDLNNEHRVSFNSYSSIEPKVIVNDGIIYIFWKDNREGNYDLYLTKLDLQANKLTSDIKLASDVDSFDVGKNPLTVGFISNGVAYHAKLGESELYDMDNYGSANEIAVDEKYALISGVQTKLYFENNTKVISDDLNNLDIYAGERLHILFGNPAKYASVSREGDFVVFPRTISQNRAIGISGNEPVALTGNLSFISSNQVESLVPTASVDVKNIRSESAVLEINSNEPVITKVSTIPTSNNNYNTNNIIELKDLIAGTTYNLQITINDLAGNSNTFQKSFQTVAQRNRPALPTSFYGRVLDEQNSPIPNLEVIAKWTDTNDNQKETITTTISETGELAQYVGYYVFNQANVNAKPGSVITISAVDSLNEVQIAANPGNIAQNVTQPIIIDAKAPVITITEPTSIVYTSPYINLIYSSDEELNSASLVLNNQNPINILGVNNVNLTGQLGQNTITIIAVDKAGLEARKSVSFTIEDLVPPELDPVTPENLRNITTIQSLASDITNPLDRCEVCIGNNCEWEPAQDDFTPGAFDGECSTNFNTNSFSDGSIPVQFRAYDLAGNIGYSEIKTARIDNTKPQSTTFSTTPIPGENTVRLSWNKVQDDNFDKYLIYRKQSPAILIAEIDNPDQTSFEDTTVESSQIYEYSIVAQDSAGNRADPIYITVTSADTVSPQIQIISPLDQEYNTREIDLIYETNEETTCTYTLNFGQNNAQSPMQIIANEGQNSLQITCQDQAGNTQTENISFSTNTIAPNQITPQVSSQEESTSLSITWQQTLAQDFDHYNVYYSGTSFMSTNDAELLVTINNIQNTQYTHQDLQSEQELYYAVTAVDTLGNEIQNVTSVKGIVADVVAPIITLTSPTDQIYNQAQVPISYTTSEDLLSCELVLNGETSQYYNSIPAPDGRNTLTINCQDIAGNIGSATVSFDVDATVPTYREISINPIPGENSLQLSWEPEGSADLKEYIIYRSREQFLWSNQSSEIARTTQTTFTDTNLESEGLYYYGVVGADIYGNEGIFTNSFGNFVPDTIAPDSINLTGRSFNNQRKVTINWEPTTANDFAHYAIYRSTQDFTNVESLQPLIVLEQDYHSSYTDETVLDSITYYYAITATDDAGNENQIVDTIELTIDDLTDPQISIVTPQEKTYTTNSIPLVIDSNEPVTCEYDLNGQSGEYEELQLLAAQEGSNTLSVTCEDGARHSVTESSQFNVDTITPNPVNIISAIATNGTSQLQITWEESNSTDLKEYRIYMSENDNFDNINGDMYYVATLQNTYTYNNLSNENTYYFAVTAVDHAGNENINVQTISAVPADITPPTHPSNLLLSLVPKTLDISLEWPESTSNDVSNYKIYRGRNPTTNSNELILVGETQELSFVDTVDLEKTQYWYAVAGQDYSDNENNQVIVFPILSGDITPPQVTIMEPFGEYGTQRVALEFSANEQVTCTYSINNKTNQPTSLTIQGEEGTNNLEIICQDNYQNEGKAFTTFEIDTTPPEKINIIANQPQRTRQVTLTWSESTANDIEAYNVYRSESEFTNTDDAVRITQTTQTSFNDINIEDSKTYYYAVTGIDNWANEDKEVQTTQIITQDLTAPVIQISSPTPGQVFKQYGISVEYSVNEQSTCRYILGEISEQATQGMIINTYEGENNLIISCTDQNQNIGNSSVYFITNAAAPEPVTGLNAQWINAVVLNWDQTSAQDLKHYMIYRSESEFTNTEDAVALALTTEITYTDAQVESETTYYYAVTAVDITDNENKNVQVVDISTPDIKAPDPITTLRVNATENLEAIAYWDSSNEIIQEYRIYRDETQFSTASDSRLIGTTDEFTYTDANLASATNYYYAVTAVDLSGNENKNVASVKITTPDKTNPIIVSQQVASPVAGEVQFRAIAHDNALASCQICIGPSCEWEEATLTPIEQQSNGTCTYEWIAPIEGDTLNYQFRAVDTSGNMGESQTLSFDILDTGENYQYTLELESGWNLISLPVLPADNKIKSVLSPISDKYTKVFHFDTLTGTWRTHFATQSIFSPAETLSNFEFGRGYWIEITEPTTLTIQGSRAGSYTVTLNDGWNHIGNPYETPLPISQALTSLGNNYNVIYTYNAIDQRWEKYTPVESVLQPNTISELEPGSGYMIEMLEATTWSPQR